MRARSLPHPLMASARHQGAIFSKMTLPIVPEPEVNRIAHHSCPPTKLNERVHASRDTPAQRRQKVARSTESDRALDEHPSDKFATAPFPVRVFKLPVLLSIEAAPLEMS